MTKGWYGDRQRHQLASKGVKTDIKFSEFNHEYKETLKDFNFYVKKINGKNMICFDFVTDELSDQYNDLYMQDDLMEIFEKFINSPKAEEYQYIFRNIDIIPITRSVTFCPDEYHEIKEDVTVGFTVCANEKNNNGTSGIYSLATVLYAFSLYIDNKKENAEVEASDMKSASNYLRNKISTYDLHNYINFVDYNLFGKEEVYYQ